MTLLKRRITAIVILFLALESLLVPCDSFTATPITTTFHRGAMNFPKLGKYHIVLLHAAEPPQECSLEDDEGAAECLSSAGYIERDITKESSFMSITQVFVAEVESLRDRFPSYEDSTAAQGSNLIKFHKRQKRGRHHLHSNVKDENTHVANMEYNELVGQDQVVLVDVVRKPGMSSVSRAFPAAGPRKLLHFNPSTVHAAIVTCGGLCPGLNNVIRELVHSLYYLYGAKTVYGIRGRFQGFGNDNSDYDPVILTNELVENIHHEGGTILSTSRGGFDIDKIRVFDDKGHYTIVRHWW